MNHIDRPKGAPRYYLDARQLADLRRGGVARDLMEVDLATFAEHLQEPLYLVSPDKSRGEAIVAVVSPRGTIRYCALCLRGVR